MLGIPLLELVATQYLTNAAATYYTSPFTAATNGIVRVTGFVFCNTDTVARTITLHNVPSGGAAAGSNKIIAEASIPANTTWFKNNENGLWIIPAAGFLAALADVTSKITLTLYGEEIS